MQLGISEIVRNAMRLPGPERVPYLQKHHSIPLVKLLQLAFDARPQWLLPRDVFIPYKPAPTNANVEGMLYSNARLLYIFLEGQNAPEMDQLRREIKFVQFLESLDGEDAKFVISVKDQRLEKDYGLTLEIVQEAFPGLIEVPIAPRPQKASVPSVGALDKYKKKVSTVVPSEVVHPLNPPPMTNDDKPAPVKDIMTEKNYNIPDIPFDTPKNVAPVLKVPKEKKPVSAASLAALAKGRETNAAKARARKEKKLLEKSARKIANEQKL